MADVKMATVKAGSRLVVSGQAVCQVRGREYRLDAPPLIDGPNEEVNPVEALIGTLAACAVLFVQYLARTMEVPVEDVSAEVEGDFDPRGVKGEADPILDAIRLTYRVKPGAGADRAGCGESRGGLSVPLPRPPDVCPRRWISPKRSSWCDPIGFPTVFGMNGNFFWMAIRWIPPSRSNSRPALGRLRKTVIVLP